MKPDILIDHEKIAEFCRKNHIRKLSFFGSVLRDDFKPASDVDVLVEFEPDATVGLIRFAGMQIELEEILGRKVDLNTPKFFRPELRSRILD
jgi:predicted nucleotidyltransferase